MEALPPASSRAFQCLLYQHGDFPSMHGIERRVLRMVTPSPEEQSRIEAAARGLVERVRLAAAELGLRGEPLLVGSVAKGTHLTHPDIDVFFLFPPDVPREELEEKGLELGMRVLGGIRRYAEHPYIRGEFGGFEAEVVPCYRITDTAQRMSAVDRTPFHTRFVAERITDAQRAEVRLLKSFLKGIGAYGAEEAVRGFSGYLAELLVLKFESFRAVLEAASRWSGRVELSLDGARGCPDERHSPLLFSDPVDPSRNVASALSLEKFSLFVAASQSYLRRPSMKFFFPRPPVPMTRSELAAMLRRRGTELVGIGLRTPSVVPDIYYSQLRKFERGIAALCEEHGFRLLASSFHEAGGQTVFIFEFEVGRLPRVMVHKGPPVGNPRAPDFIGKWRRSTKRMSAPHIREGLWAVEVRRDHTTAAELIQASIERLSLGRHLSEEVRRGYRLLTGVELLTRELALALTLHFDKRFPWER